MFAGCPYHSKQRTTSKKMRIIIQVMTSHMFLELSRGAWTSPCICPQITGQRNESVKSSRPIFANMVGHLTYQTMPWEAALSSPQDHFQVSPDKACPISQWLRSRLTPQVVANLEKNSSGRPSESKKKKIRSNMPNGIACVPWLEHPTGRRWMHPKARRKVERCAAIFKTSSMPGSDRADPLEASGSLQARMARDLSSGCWSTRSSTTSASWQPSTGYQ
jgi:hypothetical protein